MAFSLPEVLSPGDIPSQPGGIVGGIFNEQARQAQMKQAAANLQMTQLANQKAQTLLPFASPQAQADLAKSLLLNQSQQVQNQYQPSMLQSQLASEAEQRKQMAQQIAASQQMTPLQAQLMGAQTQAAIAKSKMGGLESLTGPAAQAQSYLLLRNRYPVGSPERTTIENAWQNQQAMQSARADFMGANTWLKNMPEVVKEQYFSGYQSTNAQRASQGLSPLSPKEYAGAIKLNTPVGAGTTLQQSPQTISQQQPGIAQQVSTQEVPQQSAIQQPNIAPVDYAQQAQQTQLSLQKRTSDPLNRNKIIFGNQAENTLRNMLDDAPSMYKYSGLDGQLKLKKDAALAAVGGKVPDFEAYNRYLQNAKIFKDQYTQYYGGSISPEAQQNVNSLANPTAFYSNPKIAQQNLKTLANTLNQEVNLRKQAMVSPTQFTQQSSEPNVPEVGAATTPKYSQEDLEYTAKKYNMTVDQVKNKLGVK
jgi:hypothetical protein